MGSKFVRYPIFCMEDLNCPQNLILNFFFGGGNLTKITIDLKKKVLLFNSQLGVDDIPSFLSHTHMLMQRTQMEFELGSSTLHSEKC